MSSSSPSSSSSHDPSTLTYAFLGAGNMSSSIIRGMLAKSLVKPSQIRVSSPSGPSAALRALGVFATTRNDECVAGANIIILAVKPFNIGIVLASFRSSISPDATVISIAAGMKIAQISTVCCVWGGGWHQREMASPSFRILRVMPNTPCAIGLGATAFCKGPNSNESDVATVRFIFEAVGEVHEVKESHMDAVTALSGSGPAFVFLFLEALSDGGVAAGLPRAVATALALQTVKGAAALAQSTGSHPGVLKDQVASPGGTTIEGIATLERGAFRGAVIDAVVAATKRSAELGR